MNENPIEQVEIPGFQKPEFFQLNSLYYTLNNKFFHCGFVYKANTLDASGKPLHAELDKYWMEQWGGVLHLWKVPQEVSSFSYTAALSVNQFIKNEIDPPVELMACIKSTPVSYINFSDCVVEIFDSIREAPIPYTNYFGISTAASNLYLFASASTIQTNSWVCSIRLALFEIHKLNTLYTSRLMRQTIFLHPWETFEVEPFKSKDFRGDLRFEGPLQVRIPCSSVWKEYHVIVTSKYGPEAYQQQKRKLFRKKAAAVDLSKRGSILFYQSKSASLKEKPPLFSLIDVAFINMIWPEQADEKKINRVCLAQLQGVFELNSLKQPIDSTSQTEAGSIIPNENSSNPSKRAEYTSIKSKNNPTRTFQNSLKGLPEITTIEDFAGIIRGQDERPTPQTLLILAPTTRELSKWITSINCCFGLDSSNIDSEAEIIEMTRTPMIDETQMHLELVRVNWPTQLYLSLGEVGGVTMPRSSFSETIYYFQLCLGQKINVSKTDQLSKCCYLYLSFSV